MTASLPAAGNEVPAVTGAASTASATPIAKTPWSRTNEVPRAANKAARPHFQAARLIALRAVEARHRATLLEAIQRAERGIRLAEALDERFDRRFAAVASLLWQPDTSPPSVARSHGERHSLDLSRRSEGSTRVAAYAT
jgi:hypothetical protein